MNPRRSSPSWPAKPMTSSRQSARPIATRSVIWRTFWSRLPAASTGAERSASNWRAIARPGAGRGATAGAGPVVGHEPERTASRQRPCNRCTRSCAVTAPSRHATLPRDEPPRLRVPRPGLAVGRHGPRPRRTLPGRRGGLRRGRRRARRADQPRSPGTARPNGSTGPRTPSRRSSPRRSRSSTRSASAGPPQGIEPPGPAFAAGHSMGQYSALVAAGALGLADGVRLVRERGRLMQASGQGRDGAMAAIIGLDDARLPELVAAASATRRVRRRQPERAGPGRRVGRARGDRGRRGARQGRSAPSGRSSCPSRSPPTRRSWPRPPTAMRAVLAGVDVPRPDDRRCSPTPTRARSRPPTACRAELVEHLTAGVDWVGAVERMTAAGVTTFVEVGPGRGPDRPHQAHRPRRRGHRRPTTRRRPTASLALRRRYPPDRPLTRQETAALAQARLRPPRRRHRPRRHQPRRQRQGDRLGEPGRRRAPASARSPGSTRPRTRPSRPARSTTSTPTDWMDAKAVRRSEIEHALRGRRGQAGARRLGLRDHRRRTATRSASSSARAPAARR